MSLRMKRMLALVGVALVMALTLAWPRTAQADAGIQAAQSVPQGQVPEGFTPVKELPQQEQLPAAPLLIAAYAFVWVALIVYLWTIWRRLMAVEQEMRQLSARLAERPGRR
jgi:CcmD family protein